MMADAKHILKFLQRGVGMLLNMRLEFLWVELTPAPPALFRGQRPRLRGIQIPVNRASTEVEALSGFHFGTAFVDEFHYPVPQVQCIGFHAHKPITECTNVNVKCYIYTCRSYAFMSRACAWRSGWGNASHS